MQAHMQGLGALRHKILQAVYMQVLEFIIRVASLACHMLAPLKLIETHV